MQAKPANLNPAIHCSTRKKWRTWLNRHHDSESEIWLHYYKKHTGKQTVSYRESVEEALCFGWIDGLKRRVDDARYAQRFTPRKAKSKWSPLNISLAEKMIAEGKMHPSGLAAFQRRIDYDGEILQTRAQQKPPLPAYFEIALDANPAAKQNFTAMAPGYRNQYVGWVSSAKREETRQKRLAEAITMLENNRKPGMK